MSIKDYIEKQINVIKLLEELETISGESIKDHFNQFNKDSIEIYVSYSCFDAVEKAMQLQADGWSYIDQALRKHTKQGVEVALYFS